MNRRDFFNQSLTALTSLSAFNLYDGRKSEPDDDWRPVWTTITGESWHQIGQVQLSKVDLDLIRRIDDVREAMQAALRCQYCAIVWDGPPDSLCGSCSPPEWEWPEHLRSKWPFDISKNQPPVNYKPRRSRS